MQRTYKRCPNCKSFLGSYTGIRLTIGYPIKKCPHCDIHYIDSKTKEWECMKESEKILYLMKKQKKRFTYPLPVAIFLAILPFAITTIVIASVGDFDYAILFPFAFMLLFFFLPGFLGILNYYKNKKKLSNFISDKEIIESIVRTSQVNYRVRLAEIGFDFFPLDKDKYAIEQVQKENELFEENKTNLNKIHAALKSKHDGNSKLVIDELTDLLKSGEISISEHQYLVSKVFSDIVE